MKEKRLWAVFITSVVALMVSVSVTLGVAFAFADPVVAYGLSELNYNTASNKVSQTVVFDPVSVFNGSVEENLIINSYNDILYENEAVVNNIKLLKVTVTNDSDEIQRYMFTSRVEGETNAKKYAEVVAINVEDKSMVWVTDGVSREIEIAANTTAKFIVASYVTDLAASTETVDLSGYMDLTFGIEKAV